MDAMEFTRLLYDAVADLEIFPNESPDMTASGGPVNAHMRFYFSNCTIDLEINSNVTLEET